MDGSSLEHSDSDSGESWTLLDNSPTFADEPAEFPENPSPLEGDTTEKDEDTDGISIISDSDPESSTPCELSYDKLEENRPTEQQIPEYVSVNSVPVNKNDDDNESIRSDDDFLGDNNGKHKTYVHRRNKRLSTVLNIIVLGSVITAAGVAIGHMWGARNECSIHTTPSVNKILSNLYKLQEENAYLRNKLRELTFMNNIQIQQNKIDNEKAPFKPVKCKKVFEESLNNKNADKLTKCVDNDSSVEKLLESHLKSHDYEQEFLNDFGKGKNVYEQNRIWLDEEIAKRIKLEETVKKFKKNHMKSLKSIKINEDHKKTKGENLKRLIRAASELPVNVETVINVTEPVGPSAINVLDDAHNDEGLAEKKITYADSLKSEHSVKQRETGNINTENNTNNKEYYRKKKLQKDVDTFSENSVNENELKKDDRYNAHKYKPERKKNDRHKIYKKQKRRNKYEQWEMKGGYMKDYDDFSITSTQENEFASKSPDKNVVREDHHRVNRLRDIVTIPIIEVKSSNKVKHDIPKKNGKNEKDLGWYENRVALRKEARKKLEQELFGETTPNNAGWYFRRMQRREQCRIKGDNSTYRKLSKRIMNFKTKH